MYLSKLELHGFKSFADRTIVNFSPGITVVVGPNGCGKSNIVDAVRWVIGEQRARVLRSDKMDNVIFNGTARRRAVGLSEVLLTIENTRGVLPTEYSEVTIGRRLYRSGESEYLLNDVQCRLRDITDLFMDTGMGAGAYSVIELKMIEDILSENAHDRRHLFEEAAGITRYKLRRSQTLRKLDSTQTDLTRLRDLIEELEKRVRSLKRQANKASRYKELETRLHHLELALAQAEYDRLMVQQKALKAETRSLHDQLEGHTAQMAGAEAHLEALRTEHIEREQVLVARQGTVAEHQERILKLEAERQLAQERLDMSIRETYRLVQEQETGELRRTELTHTAEILTEDLAAVVPALATARQALETAQEDRDRTRTAAETQREHLQTLRRKAQRAAEERDVHRRNLDRLTNRLELQEQDLQRQEARATDLEALTEELDAQVRHSATQQETARVAREAALMGLAEAETEQLRCTNRLNTATEAQRQAERNHDAVQTEVALLESLLSSYEEFSESVQFLAADPTWTPGPLLTVADLLSCDDADRLALDTALGPYAACVVVQSEAEAQAAITRLRDEAQGRATFLVMDRLPNNPSLTLDLPTAQALQQAVRVANPAYATLAALLLQDAYLVDTLEEAQAAAATNPNRPLRFIARTGEWVGSQGLLHGGGPTGPSAVAGRLERREQHARAEVRLAELQQEMARCAAAVLEAEQALAAVPYASRREVLNHTERALNEADKEHDRLTYAHETQARRQRELEARLNSLREALATGQAEINTLQEAVEVAEQDLAALQHEQAEKETAFQAAEADSRASLQHYSEVHVGTVQAQNRHDNLQRDLERTHQTIEDLVKRADEQSSQLDQLRHQQTETQNRLSDLAQEIEAVRLQRVTLDEAEDEAKTALMETKAAISEVEAQLREIRRIREQDMREENSRAVRLAEIETRAEDLLTHIQEDFEVSLLDDPIDLDPDFDEEAARAEVQTLRTKIRGLGPVNALALESYDEEKERLDFLSEQLRDLENAEATLLETIHEINTTASTRFNETFEAIRTNFSHLFAELFGDEATAELVLNDPGNPLESKIDVMAKPRGKRPSTLAQLSGGEKTLTAIALLFAIYLVKPSPFCILDEVDAPLDDANVDRFMHLIRTFAETTQFILVTHNKRTMEAADRMYGITMQEQGISKLVGVQFDEAIEMAEG